MCETVKFKREHLQELLSEPMNKGLDIFGKLDELEAMNSATILYHGKVQAVGGICDYWTGRGHVWTVFSEHSKHNFISVYRAIRRWLTYQVNNNYMRIELSIPCEFQIGKRRALMLGFELEVERAKYYLQGGGDCALYSMVRQTWQQA